ncbi:MAG: hypothetical protein V4469_05415 [Patescibacteria group bacterium]
MSAENPTPQEQALELLKNQLSESALNISGLYFAGASGADRTQDQLKELKPGQYAEQNNVVIFATAEGRYAVPTTSHMTELIKQAEFQLNESVGVPQLNNVDMWGPENQRAGNSGFQKWQQLSK